MDFDIPRTTPDQEKQKPFPSLEDIKTEIARFIVHPEIIGSERISGNPENPDMYEVATMDESGSVALFQYVADIGEGTATIYVSHWKGHPDNLQWLGGTNLSGYQKESNAWTNPKDETINPEHFRHSIQTPADNQRQLELPKPPDDASEAEKKRYFERIFDQASVKAARALIDMARQNKAPQEDLLEMIYAALATINKPQLEDEFRELNRQFENLPRPAGVNITSESIKANRESKRDGRSKEKSIEELSRLFDTAEKILGTTDIAELEARERDSLELALIRRGFAKPFADRTLEELLALNQSYEPYPSVKEWNPAGKLEKYEFDALSLRRTKIVNAVGSWNIRVGGIRHDINVINKQ